MSGALVAYTNEARGTSEIRYHDLLSGSDLAIPNHGAFDFVSDISGQTIVFTRVGASSAIYTFDVGAPGAVPMELAPEAGSSRRAAVIGGRTVAWQDFGFTGNTLTPEIATYDLDTGRLTRLTNDARQDRMPAVSPDGRIVVWIQCDTEGAQCDVWQATRAPAGSGWVTQFLTGGEGEESQPDTNGEVVVYSSTRALDGVAERDIYWQPQGGGIEQRLALPGTDSNPSISGSLVAFEHRDPIRGDFDIYLYDLSTQWLYRLTDSKENENLNDLSVSADGTARVVWTVPENGDFNVRALTFTLVRQPECNPPPDLDATPEQVCEASGSWPLLTALEVARTTGQPNAVALGFSGRGAGVLCVDNGYRSERSTAGWVWLNGVELLDPSRFSRDVSRVSSRVTLTGDNSLAALISGQAGSGFRIRIYGPPLSECQVPKVSENETSSERVIISGEHVSPVTREVSSVSGLTFVPESMEAGSEGEGCSSAGGGSLAWAAVALIGLGMSRFRRNRVTTCGVRKGLRRSDGPL